MTQSLLPIFQSPPSWTTVAGSWQDVDAVGQICTRYMIRLFASQKYPYPSPKSQWQASLPTFISTLLRFTGFDVSVCALAIAFLMRYKRAEPRDVAYDDDAMRLFFASYIVASKIMYDYSLGSLKFWEVAGGGRFLCREINKMEAEFCRVLEWDFSIDVPIFESVNKVVNRYAFSACGVLRSSSSGDNSPPPSYEDATRVGSGRAFVPTTAPSGAVPLLSTSSTEEDDEITLARMLFQDPLRSNKEDGLNKTDSCTTSFWSFLKKRLSESFIY